MHNKDNIVTEQCEHVHETADSETSKEEKGTRTSNAVIDVESEDYVVTFKTWIVVSPRFILIHAGAS